MLTLIKLKNGLELIGSVVENLGGAVVVEDPLQINYRLTAAQPMPVISISRYMPFADGTTFTFDVSDVMHITKPKDSMAGYYTHALQNYKSFLDNTVDDELREATRLGQEFDELDSGSAEDAYKTLLERINIKGPPN